MPTYNNISLELHCCQPPPSTGGAIEEFAPRELESTDPPNTFMPPVFDHNTRTVSVFIPIFPMQQFWLKYNTKPPRADDIPHATARNTNKPTKYRTRKDGSTIPPASVPQNKEIFYVFKLFIGNEELVTWSCTQSQDWQGKTVFGMFDTGTSTTGKGLQKRIMLFGSQGPRISGDLGGQRDQERKIEVRVFRADRVLRVPRQTSGWNREEGDEGMVRTEYGVVTTPGHPKKFFMFGLLDPLDHPYATFRFYYRYWEEINRLKLRMGQVNEEEAPDLFAKSGDILTREKNRRTIRIEPAEKPAIVVKLPPRLTPLQTGEVGVPAVTMLLPPNHPHSPKRSTSPRKRSSLVPLVPA